MPWTAPIGTGPGATQSHCASGACESAPHIPLIVDAGLGIPSHARQVIKWGFDSVLLNTAVSRALDPVRMAGAFAAVVAANHDCLSRGPHVGSGVCRAQHAQRRSPFHSLC